MKRTKKILIPILAAIAVGSAAFAAGCAVGPDTYEQYLNKNNATAHVQYNANGGEFETTLGIKDIFYPANTPIFNIGVTEHQRIEITHAGYKFDGWYFAETDAEGNVLYEDEAKTVVKLGAEVVFPYRIQHNEDIVIYAKWLREAVVEVRLASDLSVDVAETVKDENGEDKEEVKTYGKGDVIANITFTGDRLYLRDESPVTSKNATFLQYYADAECTTGLPEYINKPEGENPKNIVVYAQFIEGLWTVVKDRAAATTMFTGLGSRTNNFYIYNDIDCEGATFSLAAVTNCTIEGNGHKIYNFKYSSTNIRTGIYSPLGMVGSSANIRNLTLEDISITYTTTNTAQISGLYLICSSITDGASFTNFTVKNISMAVTDATVTVEENRGYGINNLTNANGGYFNDNFMFGHSEGGYHAGHDQTVIEKYDGLKVEGYSLSINGNVIVG